MPGRPRGDPLRSRNGSWSESSSLPALTAGSFRSSFGFMLHTRVCGLFGIEHPVVLGPMGSATSADLASAVSAAGALGTVGCVGRTPEWIAETARAIREKPDRPFGLNLLLFDANEQALEAVFKTKPPVFSTAWAWPDQDLASLFSRAHELGAKVMHMVSGVPEARRAAAAGA